MPITLKAARVNSGLSQREAAKKLGISVDTLSNYERGRSFPDVPTIKRIEQVYGRVYDEILLCPELRINRISDNGDEHAS